jgi:NitT/TauT family transport system substrate-binding protein
MNISSSITRRTALALAGGAAAAAAFGIPAYAQEPTEVTIGIVNSSSDVSFFIAEHQGYFRAAGIIPKYVVFDSGAKMNAPLGSGQLDVGGGGPSAGLYNAIARGIDIKIVADKGSQAKGFGKRSSIAVSTRARAISRGRSSRNRRRGVRRCRTSSAS